MTSLTPRNVLPAATLIAAAFFIASAVPHVIAHAPLVAHPAGFNVVLAEVQACEANSGRGHDACVDEAEGKALVRRAEWISRLEAQRGGALHDDELDAAIDAAESGRPARSSAQ